MQILTIDDLDFPDLLQAWKEGKEVGNYQANGKLQIVRATPQFLLISSGYSPTKIAIKPARNLTDAQNLALKLLTREKERGTEVEIALQAADT